VLVDTRVATIYMRPAMSVPLEVGPGRTILVRGGHAEVDDPSAMPTLLCDPRLTVELSERYRSHLPVWLETLEKQVRKPQARVMLPNGTPLEPPGYQAYTPVEPMENPPPVEVLTGYLENGGWVPTDERPDGG
jgi:hypothetical protein